MSNRIDLLGSLFAIYRASLGPAYFFFAVAGAGRLLALTMIAAISYLPRRACRYGVAL